jgi:hypothetical protein
MAKIISIQSFRAGTGKSNCYLDDQRLALHDLLLQGCNAVVVELGASLQRPTYTVSAFQR